MPLNTIGLKDAIKKAFGDQNDKDISDLANAREQQAQALTDAIAAFVRSGTVNITALTAAAPNGPVTGTGTGNIT